MSSARIVAILEAEMDAVLDKLVEKYGGMLKADWNALWIHGESSVVMGPVEVEMEKVEKKEKKKDAGRARVVSKKMQEAFLALATSHGKSVEEAAALFEDVKKQYKEMSQEDLDSKGGSFDAFARSFLAIEPEVKEKKKSKKEKAPSRIDRWTPTLTRALTKIVEESGGVMTDDRKKEFHAWVDALPAEEFASCAMEGQMRKWVLTLGFSQVQEAPKQEVVQTGGSGGAASGPSEEEDEEDLEEVEFEGETLMIGTKTGKIFRPSGSGDIWVGNAGIGRFSEVKKPE